MTDEHYTWNVRSSLNAVESEDFHYHGALPQPGDVIELESPIGIVVRVRVTHVDPHDPTHQIFGAEID